MQVADTQEDFTLQGGFKTIKPAHTIDDYTKKELEELYTKPGLLEVVPQLDPTL